MAQTKKKSQEVAKVEEKSTALAAAAPSFMKDDVGKGAENLRAEDMEVPRLILLQSLSPEVVDGDEKAGTFFHSVLEENLGSELEVVPIYADIKYMLWKPRHDGGGILARADDGVHWTPANQKFEVKPYKDNPKTVTWETKDTVAESGLERFGSSDPDEPNSQPAATKMWNFVVVLPEHPELGPMVLTMQRGMAKVGKNWSGKIKMDPNAPSFGQRYQITSKKEDTGEGPFYSASLGKLGYVESEEDYNAFKSMYEMFKKKGLEIKDVEGMEEGSSSTVQDTPEGAIDV